MRAVDNFFRFFVLAFSAIRLWTAFWPCMLCTLYKNVTASTAKSSTSQANSSCTYLCTIKKPFRHDKSHLAVVDSMRLFSFDIFFTSSTCLFSFRFIFQVLFSSHSVVCNFCVALRHVCRYILKTFKAKPHL